MSGHERNRVDGGASAASPTRNAEKVPEPKRQTWVARRQRAASTAAQSGPGTAPGEAAVHLVAAT